MRSSRRARPPESTNSALRPGLAAGLAFVLVLGLPWPRAARAQAEWEVQAKPVTTTQMLERWNWSLGWDTERERKADRVRESIVTRGKRTWNETLFVAAPSLWRREVRAEGRIEVDGETGTAAWSGSNGVDGALRDERVGWMCFDPAAQRVLLPPAEGIQMSLKTEMQLGRRRVYRMEIVGPGAFRQMLYFDASAYILVSRTYDRLAGERKVSVQENYSEYRPVDGVKLPFRTEIVETPIGPAGSGRGSGTAGGSGAASETTWVRVKSYSHRAVLPEPFFEPPEAGRPWDPKAVFEDDRRIQTQMERVEAVAESLEAKLVRARHGVDAHPEVSWSRVTLARALLSAGDFSGATGPAEEAVKLAPDSAIALYFLGAVALREGSYPRAYDLLSKSRRLKPKIPEIGEDLAFAAYHLGKHDEALATMTGAWGTVRERDANEGEFEALMAVAGREAMRIARAEPGTRVRFHPESSMPAVPVLLNGKGPFLFEVDPGAGFVRIDEDLAREVGLAGVKRSGFEYTRGETGSKVAYARLDSLRLGGFVFADVPVTIETIPPRGAARGSAGESREPAAGSPSVRGILGISLLSRTRFSLDYPGRALLVAPRGQPGSEIPVEPPGSARGTSVDTPDSVRGAPAPATPAPAADDSLLAEIPFRVYGQGVVVVDAMVDGLGSFPLAITPGIRGIEVAPAWLLTARTRPALDLVHPGLVRSGSEIVPSHPLALREVSIGALSRTRVSGATNLAPHAASHHFPLYGAICGDFLAPYRVEFDFDAMKLRFFESGP